MQSISRLPLNHKFSRLAHALLAASIVCLALSGTAATDASVRFDKLGHKMMCTCGCAQVLLECNHVGCPVSGGMRDELASAISAGQSNSAILDAFVTRYGAVVLTAPTLKGFDLLAWIMPFAVALIGLVGTIFLVRHWARQQAAQNATQAAADASAGLPAAGTAIDESMAERIRRETGTIDNGDTR